MVLLVVLSMLFVLGYVASGDSFRQPLTKEEEARYLSECAKGSVAAKNALVEHNLRLVAYMARKYRAAADDMDDLISIGTIGLIKAIANFNPDLGSKFASFASRCIDNEILMHLRNEKKHSGDVSLNEPRGTDKDGNTVTRLDIIADDDKPVDEQVEVIIHSELLREVFKEDVLNPREKEIILKRYGLYGDDIMTQLDISKIFGISRSYVSRIEGRALSKLCKAINEKIPKRLTSGAYDEKIEIDY